MAKRTASRGRSATGGRTASGGRSTERARTTGHGRRSNRQLRTRQDLLAACGRLLKRGGQLPSLDEVAEEALVSRATAYRYFPNVDALLVEAPLDAEVPQAEQVFADTDTEDAEERIDLAEARLHEMVYANQSRLRRLLAATLTSADAPGDGPRRQNRRLKLIEAALAPQRARFTDDAYDRLCAALSVIFGIESMVVLTDVHSTPPDEARRLKSWMARTLVRAALEESATPPAKGRRNR